jgi:hypothetical protein
MDHFANLSARLPRCPFLARVAVGEISRNRRLNSAVGSPLLAFSLFVSSAAHIAKTTP